MKKLFAISYIILLVGCLLSITGCRGVPSLQSSKSILDEIHTGNTELDDMFTAPIEEDDYPYYQLLLQQRLDEPNSRIDATIQQTPEQTAAILRFVWEKGWIDSDAVASRRQMLQDRNPDLPDEDAEQISAFQISADATGILFREVVPQLKEGTYETDDTILQAAMSQFQADVQGLDLTDPQQINEYDMAAARLIDEFIFHLVRQMRY